MFRGKFGIGEFWTFIIGIIGLVLDIITPIGYTLWLIYMIPLVFIQSSNIITIPIMGTILTIFGVFVSHPEIPLIIGIINRLTGIAVLWLISLLFLHHKKTETILRVSEKKFRTLFEQSPLSMQIFSSDGKTQEVNHAWEELWGLNYETLKNYNILEDKQLQAKGILSYIKKGFKGETIEIPVVLYNPKELNLPGQSRFVKAFIYPVKDNEQVKQVVLMHLDVTEQVKAEKILKRDKVTLRRLVNERTRALIRSHLEIERSKRLSELGTLAAVVAHQLRNPLATIRVVLKNMERRIEMSCESKEVLERLISTITKQVEESNQIINNILFYTRLKSPHIETVRISSFLNEIIETAKERHKESNVELSKDFTGVNDVKIDIDPLQVKEMLDNMLNNAYDALENKKGKIKVEATRNESVLIIIVKDTGKGMSKEVLKHIFDPFFTTKAKGTGLGMTVCYQITELHAGTIDIQSEIGKGTSVTISLPIKSEFRFLAPNI